MKILRLMLVLCFLATMSSCVMYTLPTGETVIAPVETETVVAVGEPWVGPGTPWYYHNDCWYYNGMPYVLYAGYGWWPYGYYNAPVIQNNYWYKPYWRDYYHKNPHHYKHYDELNGFAGDFEKYKEMKNIHRQHNERRSMQTEQRSFKSGSMQQSRPTQAAPKMQQPKATKATRSAPSKKK